MRWFDRHMALVLTLHTLLVCALCAAIAWVHLTHYRRAAKASRTREIDGGPVPDFEPALGAPRLMRQIGTLSDDPLQPELAEVFEDDLPASGQKLDKVQAALPRLSCSLSIGVQRGDIPERLDRRRLGRRSLLATLHRRWRAPGEMRSHSTLQAVCQRQFELRLWRQLRLASSL
jgi:hypothetical protein